MNTLTHLTRGAVGPTNGVGAAHLPMIVRRFWARLDARVDRQVRLRVVTDTKQTTLCEHVQRFTRQGTQVYTDECDSYNTIDHARSMVAHGHKEWARDDDGDGIREVHTNTTEGML